MNRITRIFTIFAMALLVLSLPVIASAQSRDRDDNDNYGRNRGNNDNYGRNRDDNDNYGRNRGNNDNYGNRNSVNLSYAVQNLKNSTQRFAEVLDRELDRSRINGTNREDNLNDLAKKLRKAANKLEDRFESRGDLGRSSDEARRVLDAGSQLDRALTGSRIGRNSNSLRSSWNGVEGNLRTIAQGYNLNYDGRYGNNRNNDDYDYDNNGGNNRNLRATIVSLRNNTKTFEKRVGREYNDNRNNRGGNGSDLNELASKFKDAVDQLEDQFDGRSGNNRSSSNEVRQVVDLGNQINRAIARARVSSSIQSDWNRVEEDLRVLARAYNYSYNDNQNRGWRDIFPF